MYIMHVYIILKTKIIEKEDSSSRVVILNFFAKYNIL